MARKYGGQSEYLKNREKYFCLLSLLLVVVGTTLWYFVFIKNFHIFVQSKYALMGTAVLFLALYLLKKGEFKLYKSDKFYRGRKGEEMIFYDLVKLPNSYLIFQDIKIGDKGNIDFVVVGPSGVYIIEVKSHKGNIGFDGQELTINGHVFKEKDILKQAVGEALTLHEYLKEKLKENIFVSPVLAFSDFKASVSFGLKPVNNVFVVQKRFLRKLFYFQSPVLSEEKISAIENVLKPICN